MNVASNLKEFFKQNRWVTKHENGVPNVLDIVKAQLRRITSSVALKELKQSVKSLKDWEFNGKKLKCWFAGTILFF